ncbi:MAG: inositol-3-phosphate synthase [Nitrososphaeria archaeon]
MSKIKVAIVGVGNCASSFLQGLVFYSNVGNREFYRGLRNPTLGGFYPSDIEIVSAFDVDKRKVGKDLAEAIFAAPNNTLRVCDVPPTEVVVKKGPVLDGVGESLVRVIQLSDEPESNVLEVLKESGSEMIVNLLPSGAVKASRWYAEQALKAGNGFINATPVPIAFDKKWSRRFREAGLPLVGDDLIDQVGATTLHKTLLNLLTRNGVYIKETYQLDVGGGTESLDTMERTRETKRNIKTEAIKASLPYKTEVVAGSTDYVEFLDNKRDSYFWIRGTYFCNAPLQIDLKLSTVDGPNSGSVLFDVIRATKVAALRKAKGTVIPISAYAFKHPPKQMPVDEAEKIFYDFIK